MLSELSVEPSEGFGVQFAVVESWNGGVQRNEA
jgi:hypothetical protein